MTKSGRPRDILKSTLLTRSSSFSIRFFCRGALLWAPLGLSALAAVPAVIAQPTDQHQPMIPAPPAKPITFEELATLVGEPTVVTFSGNGVPVAEVKAAMLEAAGVDAADNSPFGAREAVQEPALKNVSVNWVEIPFWKAAQQMEDLTGGRWSGSGPGGFTLRERGANALGPGVNGAMPEIAGLTVSDLSNSGDLNGNIAFDNPYLKVYAKSLSSSRNATRVFGEAEDGTKPDWKSSLTLAVYPDPKIKMEGVKVKDVKVQIAGKPPMEAKKKEGAFDMMGMILGGVNRQGLLTLTKAELPGGLEPNTILESVSGTLQLNIAVNAQVWKVADVTAKPNDNFTAKGTTVGFQNARIEDGKLKLRAIVTVPQDLLDPLAQFRAISSAVLRDAQGRRLEPDTGNPNLNLAAQNGGFGMDLTFKGEKGAPLAGPISLEWKLGGETRPLDVPFVLRDVMVP